jgi:peptidyl-tRNA hydrolase
VTGYVLKRGSSDVEAAVEKNIDEAIDALRVLLKDGVSAAMKQLHTKESKDD